MKVSELIAILNAYDPNTDIIVYNDCTCCAYDISCIDTDESEESASKPQTAIFISPK